MGCSSNGLIPIRDSAQILSVIRKLYRLEVKFTWQLTNDFYRVPIRYLPKYNMMTIEPLKATKAMDTRYRLEEDVQKIASKGEADRLDMAIGRTCKRKWSLLRQLQIQYLNGRYQRCFQAPSRVYRFAKREDFTLSVAPLNT